MLFARFWRPDDATRGEADLEARGVDRAGTQIAFARGAGIGTAESQSWSASLRREGSGARSPASPLVWRLTLRPLSADQTASWVQPAQHLKRTAFLDRKSNRMNSSH